MLRSGISPSQQREWERIETLRGAITRGLSGRDTPILLDADPASRYCIGVLTPPVDDTDERRAQRRSRRKPDALGFAARVAADDGRIVGEVALSFALYHRELPTFVEQQPTDDEVDRGGTQRLRQKYRRTDVRIERLPFSICTPDRASTADMSLETANARIAQHLAEHARLVASSPGCWPGDSEIRVQRADLEDEERYRRAIPKRPPELPIWRLRLVGTLLNTGDGWRLTILAQNTSEGAPTHPIEVFDVRLEVTLTSGRFQSEPFAAAAQDYRYRTVSWGRGVNAVLEVTDDGLRARTETLPLYAQPRTRSTNIDRACETSVLAGDRVFPSLAEIESSLERYADRWEEENQAWGDNPSAGQREEDLARFRAEIGRFRAGVTALHADPRLLQAFQFANCAAARRGLGSWRVFQLVFIVSVLPSLLARERPDDPALRAELDQVDVLWFPTGGGKTEASFGVILTAMFFDRLRGKRRGVTAWLRYPLRMLSIQQLQRLTEFVVAAEAIRQEVLGSNGGDPFLVGYYVGSDNTPNELTHAKEPHPIREYARAAARSPDGESSDLRVLQRCPFCNAPQPRVEIKDDLATLRIEHRCRDASCGRVAPILISDSEIYRYAPTVLVGTVDRLARAGQTDRFSHLFGQFDAVCEQHGYVSCGHCVEDACQVKPSRFRPIGTVYDPAPALLLQDELHLLKESLGTYDAHFEGFLDVASSSVGTGLPPKRLAATATIEGYRKHVRELYGRPGRRFPEKGIGEHDSAYTALDEEAPVRRVYVGVLPFGVDSDEVAARIAEIVEAEAGRYWEDPACDPVIAGRYDLALVYVNEKNTAGNIGARLNTHMEVKVLTGDRSLDEVRAAIDQIEGDTARPFAGRLKTLVATSLISHGVDLNRLNVMTFVGFPGRAADYIQSSSRVGRDNLGLVVTIFDPVDALNRSTYLHFHEYHERLYQLVQPVPINRFSEASVGRTFTGIYSALLLNVVGPRKKVAGKLSSSLLRGTTCVGAFDRGILTDDELITLVEQSYGIAEHGLPTEVVERLQTLLRRKVRIARQQIEANEEWATYQRLRPLPVSSLRDVEEQIEFGVRFRDRSEVDKVRGY